jgi:uncharacterized repeat protein (TIGR04042 family)
MPEMKFDIRWPNGDVTRCYSPSLVVTELLATREYPLFELLARVRAGLTIGAERVRLKYGYYCSAALDQLEQIERTAEGFAPESTVTVLGLYPAGESPPPLGATKLRPNDQGETP